MLLRGDQELAGRVELMGVPAGAEHSLAEDKVHVSWFPDAEAYPHVHLRSHGTLPHSFLRWPLGRGYECHGQGSPEACNRVGVIHCIGCLLGQLGVFIDDDDERGHLRGWIPGTPAVPGEVFGAGLENCDRVAEQCGCLVRGGGEPV